MKTKKLKERKPAGKASERARERSQPEFWLWTIGLLVALFAAFEVYGPALHGPFLFDDSYLPMNVPGFAHNPFIVWLRGTRPLLMASYFVNERLAGTDTAQYHEWNVLIHFLNALLVYFIVRKLLQLASAPANLALFAAGLFLLHPLQTETAAYIAGRSDGLSSFFCFGAFALFLYRRSQAITWPVALGVVALFGAAMATKENTVVLPALLLLTDYFWNPGFSFAGIRRNWRLYGLMAAGSAIGAVKVIQVLTAASSAGFRVKDLSWYDYLFTQFRVFFIYLRLFLFPIGQTVDYDFSISHTIVEHGAIFGLIGILALLAAAIYYRRRYPLACYGFLVFVILLAPTSSLIPIKDPIAERRVYLPMIGLLLMAIDLIRRVPIKPTALAAALGAVLLIAAALTYRRSIVWSGAIPLWEDAVQKSPTKARAHFQLAFAFYQANLCHEAEAEYQKASQLQKPDYMLLLDWALAENCLGKSDEAIAKLQQAAAIEGNAHVYSQLGMMYAKTGRTAEAFQALVVAQNIDPNFEPTYVYRGQLFQTLNNPAAAEQQFRRVLDINPENQQALDALQQLHTGSRIPR
jgi:tetratricopeptide (TPR) repeat protein